MTLTVDSITEDKPRLTSPARGELAGERLASLLVRPIFWVFALALLFLVPVVRSVVRTPPALPRPLVKLPEYTLTDHRGTPFGSANLRGKTYVADFVFTTCPTVCPRLTQRMVEIQRRARNLGDAFHLVTFTVDPETDTPERLADYARAHKASAHRWTFLTGALGDVETVVVKGFKMAMGKEEKGEGIFEIFHGERLVLVDGEGQVRGYYEATDEGVNDLLRDAGLVASLYGLP